MKTITLYRCIAGASPHLRDWVFVSDTPCNADDIRRGTIPIDEFEVEIPELTEEMIDAAIKRVQAQANSSAVRSIDEQDKENAA